MSEEIVMYALPCSFDSQRIVNFDDVIGEGFPGVDAIGRHYFT